MAKGKQADVLGAILGETPQAEQDTGAVRMNYYLTRELVARVRSYGKRRGLSASTVVKLALGEYLDKHGG